MPAMPDSKLTPAEQFCLALQHLIQHPPPVKQIEAGHRPGQACGMVVFELLPGHIPLGSLDIDRFALHLVQLTGNQLKVRQGPYWIGEFKSPRDALVLLSCSGNRPVSLAKLLDVIRRSSTSLWLRQNAGK